MSRWLPPLNALKAFEAAARSESFTRAAEELNVTQGAVSHQVKALEDALGLKLFLREHQKLALTNAGRDYLAVVRDAFDRIAAGTERITTRGAPATLTVSTSPDFAAKWMVHRLGRFAEANPDLTLRISASTHRVDFARDDADMAIRLGDGKWPGLDVVRLTQERLYAVCSPKWTAGRYAIRRPQDLLRVPLLRLKEPSVWNDWFAAAGVPMPALNGPVLNQASILIDAAVNGQGVALARTTLAAWDLISGRLVRPLSLSLPLANTYWIVCPKASANAPRIAAFRAWLLAEARDDARKLKQTGKRLESAEPAP